MFDALVYNAENESWQGFTGPISVLVANTGDDVAAILDEVESACAKGCYAVGFVSFEAASSFDPALVHHRAGPLPLAAFAIYDQMTETALASVSGGLQFAPVLNESDFSDSIGKIKQYLQGGDSYQVNFTHPLKGKVSDPPASVFSFLCRAQPSPYAVFIETQDYAVCSVSPELFFELSGTSIRMEPMKGTRPRGRFGVEDELLRADLESSQKDRAENLMIVDMVRNDLSRIARPGSVTVDELFSIRRFPTVWQQVSGISAETACSLAELFKALFPCASVTGAPKTRTMEIIHELETEPRGVYTGAIGVVRPGREARFSVAIRTLTIDKKADTATYGVGGGIVWDSDPAEEWQESLTKGRILDFATPPFRLLETFLYEPTRGVTLLEPHLGRLQASADYFGFNLDVAAVRQQLGRLHSDIPKRVRLLVARTGEVDIEVHELPRMASRVRLRLASTAVDSQNIFLFHKTTHREVYDRARENLQGCDDVILWNEKGELTETTISNLFLEIDGELLTPPVACGLLAGTWRGQLLEEGRVREAILTRDDLARASELYVANSVRGMQPADLVG